MLTADVTNSTRVAQVRYEMSRGFFAALDEEEAGVERGVVSSSVGATGAERWLAVGFVLLLGACGVSTKPQGGGPGPSGGAGVTGAAGSLVTGASGAQGLGTAGAT